MWKDIFPANLNLNNVNEFEKNIYSAFLYEDLYQKLNKSFGNFITIDLVSNILNEEDIDLVNEETAKDKDLKQSHTEIGTYEREEEVKLLQENEEADIIILDGSNEKTRNDNQQPTIFKRSKQKKITYLISLSVRTTVSSLERVFEVMENSIA